MFTKLSNTMLIWFALCILLTSIQTTNSLARVDYSTGRTKCPSSPEMMTLRILGLSEDANDNEIVKFLDVPDKRIFAITLIEHKGIYSAIPKLLQIISDVNENDAIVIDKTAAAEALCTLGNREWMPTIKALSVDPNGMISRTSYKLRVAGLLARAGDYSQFEILKNGLTDSKDYIRSTSIYQLRNFGHKTDPVTDSAVELLLNAAKTEKVMRSRESAIESLEKLAKVKPALRKKVIEALEANINSADKNLQIICKAKLMAYKKEESKSD